MGCRCESLSQILNNPSCLKPFPDSGIFNKYDTGTIAPWGLYAAKYIEGKPYPIIMHFVYYKDGGPFFKGKSYTIEDIMWSVRFGVKGEVE